MTGLDLDRFARIDPRDPDALPRKWARRTVIGAAASAAVLLLATTGHEPTDNGRSATPVASTRMAQVCWVEANAATPEGVELLRGNVDDRPARSIAVRCPTEGPDR